MRVVLRYVVGLAVLAVSCKGSRPAPAVEKHPRAASKARSSSSAVLPERAAEVSEDATLPTVRERQSVVVDGVTEEWRIEWIRTPTRVCFDKQWEACECLGFAFGEEGFFELVRARPGMPDERLPFQGAVQRWPVLPGDSARWFLKPVDAAEVTKRPEVQSARSVDPCPPRP